MDSINFTDGSMVCSRYQIVAAVGSGGMGTVYRALDCQLNRTVALKVLTKFQVQGDTLKNLQREAAHLAKVRHDGIVSVYSVGVTEEGTPFIVTEFAEGRTLRGYLEQWGKADVTATIRIAEQLALALGHMHANNLVHRDLKPENIMIQELAGGELLVKVIDLGLATCLTSTNATTRTGALIGTPAYMSPEQCKGLKSDSRSDMYALGCVLYEMLAGAPPFKADEPLAYLHKHCIDEPDLLSVPENSHFAEGLSSIIFRCLSKSPADRYANGAELARELQSLAQGDLIVHLNRRNRSRSTARLKSVLVVSVILLPLLAFLCLQRQDLPEQATVQPHVPVLLPSKKDSFEELIAQVDKLKHSKESPVERHQRLEQLEAPLLASLAAEKAKTNGSKLRLFKGYERVMFLESEVERSHEVGPVLDECNALFESMTSDEQSLLSVDDLLDVASRDRKSDAAKKMAALIMKKEMARNLSRSVAPLNATLMRLSRESDLFFETGLTAAAASLIEKVFRENSVLSSDELAKLSYLQGCCSLTMGDSEAALSEFRRSLDGLSLLAEGTTLNERVLPENRRVAILIDELFRFRPPQQARGLDQCNSGMVHTNVLVTRESGEDRVIPTPSANETFSVCLAGHNLTDAKFLQQWGKLRFVSRRPAWLQPQTACLNFCGNPLSDSCIVKCLRTPLDVVTLDLRKTKITDAVTPHLACLASARDLRLSGTSLSYESIQFLKQRLPYTRIESEFGSFEPGNKQRMVFQYVNDLKFDSALKELFVIYRNECKEGHSSLQTLNLIVRCAALSGQTAKHTEFVEKLLKEAQGNPHSSSTFDSITLYSERLLYENKARMSVEFCGRLLSYEKAKGGQTAFLAGLALGRALRHAGDPAFEEALRQAELMRRRNQPQDEDTKASILLELGQGVPQLLNANCREVCQLPGVSLFNRTLAHMLSGFSLVNTNKERSRKHLLEALRLADKAGGFPELPLLQQARRLSAK